MILGEVKDVIREHFGRMGISTSLVDIALKEGRKLVEKEANFWWMRGTIDFVLGVNQQDYVIGTGEDVEIDNFKDGRALQWKKTTDVRWSSVDFGTMDEEELNLMYDETDTGNPEAAIMDNVTLKVYPPFPDQQYDMRFYYYAWTDNPTLNTDTDDLLKNWGMCLVYAGVIWGYEIILKDLQGAGYWRNLLGGTPYGRGGEIAKLKRENLKRDWKDRIILEPHDGPGPRSFRKTSNMQIYSRLR